MSIIKKTSGGVELNDLCIHELQVIEKYANAIQGYGFDTLPIVWGVNPSPDFGYFDLASRYWRASLCIYMSGGVHCFYEKGVGFTEPWLFNARHSFELTIKGLKLFTVWLEALNEDISASGYIANMKKLKSRFSSLHSLSDLYKDYKNNIHSVLLKWSDQIPTEPPSVDEFMLSYQCEAIVNELNEIDPKSFRFRYPSISNNKVDEIQRLDWKHEPDKLLPHTGLPKDAGLFFDHIKTVNSIHDLNAELTKVVNLYNSIWDYIGDMQSYIGSSNRLL